MFYPLSALATTAFAVLAVAAPNNVARETSECNTGTLQCCNSVQQSNSPTVAALLTSLGIPVGSVIGDVGVTCTPITIVGTGSGATCTQQPVCCKDNRYNGVVNIGCSPVNLNL
ncbi:hydrophobin 2 [Melanogaster broomeanus]|nr:hydrophobin 2 [Melanogaster broomeanus]